VPSNSASSVTWAPSCGSLSEDDRPLDLTRDADPDYVWQKFSDAEAERRRIRKRQKKRYEEQRKLRGSHDEPPRIWAASHRAEGAQPPGARPGYRADPARGGSPYSFLLVNHSTRSSSGAVRLASAWTSRRGLSLTLWNDDNAYVKAGVRTPETQAALRALHGQYRQAYGYDRAGRAEPELTGDADLDAFIQRSMNGHPRPEDREDNLSGLVACGVCADAIGDPREALMIGRYLITNQNPFTLVCKGVRSERRGEHGQKRFHDKEIHVCVHRIRPLIVDKLLKLRDPAVSQTVVTAWRDEPAPKEQRSLREMIERRLADLDKEERGLDRQARGAMRLAASRCARHGRRSGARPGRSECGPACAQDDARRAPCEVVAHVRGAVTGYPDHEAATPRVQRGGVRRRMAVGR
jgi:hypothetical protein